MSNESSLSRKVVLRWCILSTFYILVPKKRYILHENNFFCIYILYAYVSYMLQVFILNVKTYFGLLSDTFFALRRSFLCGIAVFFMCSVFLACLQVNTDYVSIHRNVWCGQTLPFKMYDFCMEYRGQKSEVDIIDIFIYASFFCWDSFFFCLWPHNVWKRKVRGVIYEFCKGFFKKAYKRKRTLQYRGQQRTSLTGFFAVSFFC